MCYYDEVHYIVIKLGVFLLNQKNLLGPIIIRFLFFALNLFFLIQINDVAGWSFLSILLAFFATRDFVQGVRLSQIYYHITKSKNDQNKKK